MNDHKNEGVCLTFQIKLSQKLKLSIRKTNKQCITTDKMRPPKSRKIRALTTFIPHQTPFCLLGIIFLYSLLIGLSTQSLWCYRHNELHSMAISDCTQPTNAFESETLRISVESAFPFPPKAFDDDLVKVCWSLEKCSVLTLDLS